MQFSQYGTSAKNKLAQQFLITGLVTFYQGGEISLNEQQNGICSVANISVKAIWPRGDLQNSNLLQIESLKFFSSSWE